MTNKEIIAAYYREIEKVEVLEGEAERVAFECYRAVNQEVPNYYIFVRYEVKVGPYDKRFEIAPRGLPTLTQMIRQYHDLCMPSLRKEIRLLPTCAYVGESFSDHCGVEYALADAMVLEWRKDGKETK